MPLKTDVFKCCGNFKGGLGNRPSKLYFRPGLNVAFYMSRIKY